jgi:fumarate reductase subunit C
MSARRPYMRPMAGWWKKNPFFVEYMVHEATAFFVALYALILLVSAMRLADGEAAWNRWVGFLTSPACVVIHIAILIACLYHTWTWFNIMPRTLPPIMVGGERVSGATITRSGLAAAAIACLVVLAISVGLAK